MSVRRKLSHLCFRALASSSSSSVSVSCCERGTRTLRSLSCLSGDIMREDEKSRMLSSNMERKGSRMMLPQGSANMIGHGRCLFSSSNELPDHTELTMPALSPTMSQGNIVAWKKKVGDEIQPGDIYCDVETDKATIEWEAQEEGFLARILASDGTKDVEVGTPVAVLVEEEGDIDAFKDYQPGAGAAAEASTTAEEPASKPAPSESSSSAPSASYPDHEVMSMPALSPTMSQGNIVAWKKKEGDEVQPGDVFAEVETDKATIDWECQEEGFIAKFLVPQGTSGINVGDPVMIIVDNEEDVAAFKDFTVQDIQGKEPASAEPSAPRPPTPPPKEKDGGAAESRPPTQSTGGQQDKRTRDRIIASPYAKKLAAEAGISLAGVAGSGPHGRIVAADVKELRQSGGAPAEAPAAAGRLQMDVFSAFTDVETSQIRRVIARRLLESKQQVPHYYLTISCRIDQLLALRRKLNDRLAEMSEGGKISVNDFVIAAAARAAKAVPEANSAWYGDFIRQYHSVDCSVAVQTEKGLLTPIVRDADRKGLAAISAEVKELASRAKAGKLQPEEFTGGTLTVSNLGMFGVSQFAAIVNPPQSAILAVGAAEDRVVPSKDGGFEIAKFMTVTR